MKIVAFLQNVWVRDPERWKQVMERHPSSRRRCLAFALFSGCLTGRRLKEAFGEELCRQIVWEEASSEVGSRSSDCFPPDLDHIRQVLGEEKPDLVLAFGRVAEEGVRKCWSGPMVFFPHPAARNLPPSDMISQWLLTLQTAMSEVRL